MSNKAEQITVRVTSEQRERWDHFAKQDRRTLADWVRIQVDATCDRLEKSEKKSK